jgi:hypothetical protein
MIRPMLAECLIEILVELIRSLLIDGLVDRVRKLRPQPPLRGIGEVRRHIHRVARNRLVNRLSTESGVKKPYSSNFPYFTKFGNLLR